MLGEFQKVATLAQLICQMDIAFVPSTYYQNVKINLQELKQGSRSVLEYYHEMVMLCLKAEIEEDDMSIQARFLQGLNTSIWHTLSVLDFRDILQMVSKANVIKDQHKEMVNEKNRFFGGGNK